MKRPPDLDLFPPFAGFPDEGMRFLRSLKKNNRREWFAAHKSEYDEFVKLPMQSLAQSLKSPMATVAPGIEVSPKKSVFRIYRDTRFSRDKTPYKTHASAHFGSKGLSGAGYYLHIEPAEVYVGGGFYMPDGPLLKRIRHSIAARPDAFKEVVEAKEFRKKFGGLEGERLSRNPLGFPANHPMIEWLKFKSFYAGVSWKPEVCRSPKFVDRVVETYRALWPLVTFLNDAIR